MGNPFRYAMCNEAFEAPHSGGRYVQADLSAFAAACRVLRSAGYEGIEIAPFTLAPDPLEIDAAKRAEYRRIMAGEGMAFAGLHWLLVTPRTIHVTTPDAKLRADSWTYVRNLVDLCADLGDNGVMVFGSPKQRSSTGGLSPAEATRNFIDGMASITPLAEARGVSLLMEALPGSQSDVVNTLADAAEVVRQIGSPAVRTMFDCHNAEDETVPHDALIEQYFDRIGHVHVNEMDGRHPGTGDYDFVSIFRTLKRLDYSGWVSLEAFDFEIGAERIATETIEYLRVQEAAAIR
jgi:sugar phosphate isomerase/epimerase